MPIRVNSIHFKRGTVSFHFLINMNLLTQAWCSREFFFHVSLKLAPIIANYTEAPAMLPPRLKGVIKFVYLVAKMHFRLTENEDTRKVCWMAGC